MSRRSRTHSRGDRRARNSQEPFTRGTLAAVISEVPADEKDAPNGPVLIGSVTIRDAPPPEPVAFADTPLEVVDTIEAAPVTGESPVTRVEMTRASVER